MRFLRNGIVVLVPLWTSSLNQGKEFCTKLSDELLKRLCSNHSPHHLQCNSQAEVANKTIAKYLASFCDNSTLDWELCLQHEFSSLHQKHAIFFLTFGMEPWLPTLPTPDIRCKFYGESTNDYIICKLLFAQEVARQNNKDSADAARIQVDTWASPHKFLLQQLVLLGEHSFLHKHQKLAPKWSGHTEFCTSKKTEMLKFNLSIITEKLSFMQKPY